MVTIYGLYNYNDIATHSELGIVNITVQCDNTAI